MTKLSTYLFPFLFFSLKISFIPSYLIVFIAMLILFLCICNYLSLKYKHTVVSACRFCV